MATRWSPETIGIYATVALLGCFLLSATIACWVFIL